MFRSPRRLKVGEFILLTDKVYEVIRVGLGSATVQPVDARHATFDTADGRAVEFDAPAGRMIIAPTSEVQRVNPAEVATMAKKTKSEKEAKAPKVSRAKKEEGLMTFAFRLTPEESKAIHEAAGKGGASKFVRAILSAACNEASGRIDVNDIRATLAAADKS
jgi:hypothetical protein